MACAYVRCVHLSILDYLAYANMFIILRMSNVAVAASNRMPFGCDSPSKRENNKNIFVDEMIAMMNKLPVNSKTFNCIIFCVCKYLA